MSAKVFVTVLLVAQYAMLVACALKGDVGECAYWTLLLTLTACVTY